MARIVPSSLVRSRKPIASVFPRMSAMITRITRLTTSSAERMAEEPATKFNRNAFSVSECVSLSLFAKSASMSWMTRVESFGFAILMVNSPTVSLRLGGSPSFSRAHWKKKLFAIVSSSGE